MQSGAHQICFSCFESEDGAKKFFVGNAIHKMVHWRSGEQMEMLSSIFSGDRVNQSLRFALMETGLTSFHWIFVGS